MNHHKHLGRLFDVIDKDSVHEDFSLRLQSATSRHAYWLALQNAQGQVTAEGRLDLPDCDVERMIMRQPGFPRSQSNVRDIKLTPELLNEGIGVMSLRHVSSYVDAPNVHCPEAVEHAKKFGRKTLGEQQPYRIDQMAAEGPAVLNAFGASDQVKHLSLDLHSGAGLLGSYGLTSGQVLPEVMKKIDGAVIFGGFLSPKPEHITFTRRLKLLRYLEVGPLKGVVQELREWLKRRLFRGYLQQCDSMNLVDPEENIAAMEEMFHVIEHGQVPPDFSFVLVNHEKDELIDVDTAREFLEKMGGGVRITDRTEKGEQEWYHDFDHMNVPVYKRLLGWLRQKFSRKGAGRVIHKFLG